MEHIKVSVIVPVYNVEKYLPQCLDSLVKQTLNEIEVLVVNDGSVDNSQKVIDDYVRRFPKKIKSFIKENGGLSDARNYGVKRARGEYLAFVDSDDFVREDMCEIMYEKAQKEDADVVVCNYWRYQERMPKECLVVKHLEYFGQSVEESPKILLEAKSLACNKIFRRDWYADTGLHFPCGQWYEDSAVVYNMLYCARKVSAVTESLYYYRVDRADSITNTISNKIFDIFKSCKSIHMFYYANTTNKAVLDAADRVCQIHLFVRLEELLKRGSVKMKFRYYNEMLDFYQRYMPKWANNPYYKKIKKKNVYLRIRHIPLLMYLYMLVPPKAMQYISKIAKRVLGISKPRKKKAKQGNYICNERLRELQLIELDILKEVDRICKKHGIKYYLGEGSLLGAVRHHGFIPWDDDLDILMLREEYEKFLDVVDGSIDDKYLWINERNNESYYLPFTKVFSVDDHGFVNRDIRLPDAYKGPFIDIFPVDYCDTTDAKKIDSRYRKIRYIRDVLLLKCGYFKKNTWKRKQQSIPAKLFSYTILHRKLKRLMTASPKNAPYLCNFASSYHPSRQIVPKEMYGEPKYVQFEDGLFPIPQNAEGLLEKIYGDYLQMPSVRKRKSKHGFYDEISVASRDRTEPLENEVMESQVREEIRRLQMYGLDILKEVDRVCRENNITYYLTEGTLLGAIRHHGFIPWDDDVDIAMPREDLERFMQICDKKLKPNYKLQYYHNVPRYWVQSPKVRLLDKTEFSQPALRKFTDDVGPYIDIFPLDKTPDSFIKTKRQERYIKIYRRILFLKTGFSKPRNWKHKLLKMYSKFLTVETIHERMIKKATQYSDKSDKYWANFGSYYAIRKEVFPVEAFGAPIYVEFEDALFPVPSNYQYVLATTYGNYMELPPENKRVAKHSFG